MAKKKKKSTLLEIGKLIVSIIIEKDLEDTFGETGAEMIINDAKEVYDEIKDYCDEVLEKARYEETIKELLEE